MTHQLFDPLSFLGFDSTLSRSSGDKYPFYNIISDKTKNDYKIEIAVAGFTRDDLAVYVEGSDLHIEGKKVEKLEPDLTYDWHGISTRDFTRTFVLGKGMEVQDVALDNGILTICLERAPDKNSKLLTIK